MNTTITTLLENAKTIEDKINTLKDELASLNDKLRKAYNNESNLYNEVLKHSIVDVIKIIEKKELFCDKITSGSPQNNQGIIFTVTDGINFATIMTYHGTLIMQRTTQLNNDNSKNFYNTVQDIIDTKLIPYCEKHKNEYVKETEWY